MDRSGGPGRRGSWLVKLKPASNPRLRLVLAPHAGGGPSTYLPWRLDTPDEVELHAVQMPGRERRIAEPPLDDLDVAAAEIAQTLELIPDDLPIVLFGHSFGAMLSFEVVRHLVSHGRRPLHLFVSACRAPDLPARAKPIHALPTPEFTEALRRLRGTPEEVLKNGELMALLLPAIRADYAAFETYRFMATAPLEVPITAYGGTSDETVTRLALSSWQNMTRCRFRLRLFPGGHFFLRDVRRELVASILEDCLTVTHRNERLSMGLNQLGDSHD